MYSGGGFIYPGVYEKQKLELLGYFSFNTKFGGSREVGVDFGGVNMIEIYCMKFSKN